MKNPFKLTADGFVALSMSLIVLAVAALLANRFGFYASAIFLISVLEVGVLGVICVDATKDLLVSRYFISKGQTRHYSRVNLDSKGILLLAAFGCAASMTIDVIVFGIAAALILILSVLMGRASAKDDIAERKLISEMTEEQKNFRSSLINHASELLSHGFDGTLLVQKISKTVGSIDYCVNYLPIDILMKDLDSYEDNKDLSLIDKLQLIASKRATERVENGILSNAIHFAQYKRLESFEDYRKYFN